MSSNLPAIMSKTNLQIKGFDSDDEHDNVQGELDISDNEDLPEQEDAQKKMARQMIKERKKQKVIKENKKQVVQDIINDNNEEFVNF